MAFLVFFSPSSCVTPDFPFSTGGRGWLSRRVCGGRMGGRISKGIGDGVLMAHVMAHVLMAHVMAAGLRSGAGSLIVDWLPHKPAKMKK